MARLFADENFPLPAVAALRALGHTVMTIHEAGKGDQSTPDSEVLTFAASQGMAVLTMNRRHFIRLHTEIQNHAGIIACTFDRDFASQAQRIHSMIEAESPLDGKLLRINRLHP